MSLFGGVSGGGSASPGADGNTVLYGAGAPTSGLGVNGNFYIDTTAHAIYGPKTGGSWGASTSMVGTNGVDGDQVIYGSGAPASGTGADGDTYIDNTAHVLYGPKAGGAWPAGTSLVGPQGTGGDVKRTVLTADGSFTRDPKTKALLVQVWGAGGGGGGGPKGAASTANSGGAGGGGGAFEERLFDAATVGSAPIACTVGIGGRGGNLSLTANGSQGANGNSSTFGSLITAWPGGGGGGGGTSSSGGGGGAGNIAPGGAGSPGTAGFGGNIGGGAGSAVGGGSLSAMQNAGGGGAGTSAGGGGNAGGQAARGGAGGGSGGGVTAANVAANGGAGGRNQTINAAPAGGISGANGAAGGASLTSNAGFGGAGGGANIGSAGGGGGAGQTPGGGGGGGGASQTQGGTGGNGGDGLIVITEFLGP